MPRISSFYGITIAMYWDERDHHVPHFHAEYGGQVASVALDGSIIAGALAPRARRLVREWARLHEAELLRNWRRARHQRPLDSIAPLP